MSNHKFSVDLDTKNNDLVCLICHELMIDAYQSICFCQFCNKCIQEYLEDGVKYCSGAKTECSKKYLHMDRNITRNVEINKRVCNLKVICPNELCQSKIELTNMNEHLRICIKQSMECPFVRIGCDNRIETIDTISTHLNRDTLMHSKLLIKCIEHLKNEVDILKNKFYTSSVEISTLREESKKVEIEFKEAFEQMTLEKSEMVEQMTELKRELKDMNEESVNKDKKNATLKKQLKKMKYAKYSKSSALVETTKKKDNHKELIDSVTGIGRMETGDIWAEFLDLMEIMTDVTEERIKINVLDDSVSHVGGTESSERIDVDRETRMNNWIKSCPNIDAHFVWKITEWTEKRERLRGKRIRSESFYSNNYKLFLRLLIVNDAHIWLRCVIMKGVNDDSVKWPMNCAVTLAIVNQDTLSAHNSVIIRYKTYQHKKSAFDRPKTDRNNYGIGTKELIVYSSIKDNPSIIVDDSIVVSCITRN